MMDGAWVKSSYCDGGACIEVGHATSVVAVRDTKQKHLGDARTVLAFTPDGWQEFISRVKAGPDM